MLERIKLLASRGDVQFKHHAIKRMDERGAIVDDVLNAIATATSATKQDNGNYAVDDLDNDDLTVIVAVEADVLVITIY